MRDLKGKVAVITGAASGIGAALARQLAEAGCDLAMVDVQAERLRRSAAEARERGAQVSTHVVDVTDEDAMKAMAAAAIAFHGRVHLVFNNAGVTVFKRLTEHSREDWDWVLGVNLRGVIHGCQSFLPHLLEHGEGHIVNISSLFGILGVPAQTSYCASKYAVRGLSEALMEELRGTGVSVTVVHPGGINTDIAQSARSNNPEAHGRISSWFASLARPADAAAVLIIAAVRRDQPRLLIGAEAHLVDALKRLLPTWGNRLVVSLAVRAGSFSALARQR